MVNQIYHKLFSLAMKRYMFSLYADISPFQYEAIDTSMTSFIALQVKTKDDAYAYCKKYDIKGNHHTVRLSNSITRKEIEWLKEASYDKPNMMSLLSVREYPVLTNFDFSTWLRCKTSFTNYYNAFVYDTPPLDTRFNISAIEMIVCLYRWLRLKKEDKNVFKH